MERPFTSYSPLLSLQHPHTKQTTTKTPEKTSYKSHKKNIAPTHPPPQKNKHTPNRPQPSSFFFFILKEKKMPQPKPLAKKKKTLFFFPFSSPKKTHTQTNAHKRPLLFFFTKKRKKKPCQRHRAARMDWGFSISPVRTFRSGGTGKGEDLRMQTNAKKYPKHEKKQEKTEKMQKTTKKNMQRNMQKGGKKKKRRRTSEHSQLCCLVRDSLHTKGNLRCDETLLPKLQRASGLEEDCKV